MWCRSCHISPLSLQLAPGRGEPYALPPLLQLQSHLYDLSFASVFPNTALNTDVGSLYSAKSRRVFCPLQTLSEIFMMVNHSYLLSDSLIPHSPCISSYSSSLAYPPGRSLQRERPFSFPSLYSLPRRSQQFSWLKSSMC